MIVKVIYGPPCSGKSTYVAERLGDKDVAFDYDRVLRAITNRTEHTTEDHVGKSLVNEMRYNMIYKLKENPEVETAYLIASRITPRLSNALADYDTELIPMETDKETCLERLEADDSRPDKAAWRERIESWFAENAEMVMTIPTTALQGEKPMPFYRFARMERENRSDLYIEGIMQDERPWWDDLGNVACPSTFREGLEAAGDGLLVVHVNSPGGSLSAGIAIFEMLRQRPGKTRCEISFAASAATLIPCGCSESYISPAGMVMIHNPQMVVVGDEVEMDKAARAYRAWKDAAIAAYRERIKKTPEEIGEMMTREEYFNAKAAVDLGLCDGILERAGDPISMRYNRQAVMRAEAEAINQMAAAMQKERKDLEALEREELQRWASS